MGGKTKKVLYRKLPGEAPEVHLPEISEPETKVEAKLEEKRDSKIEAAKLEEKRGSKVETIYAIKLGAARKVPKESVQAARAALKGAMEATKESVQAAGMTLRDLVMSLDMVGAIIYDRRVEKYACWTCGAYFETGAQIKAHFEGRVEVPKMDFDALVADAKRARARAVVSSRVDKFLGDIASDNEEEILVSGKCAKGCFYRTVFALSAGRSVEVVPRGKRTRNIVTLVKQIVEGVTSTETSVGVRLSLSPIVQQPTSAQK